MGVGVGMDGWVHACMCGGMHTCNVIGYSEVHTSSHNTIA